MMSFSDDLVLKIEDKLIIIIIRIHFSLFIA